MFNKVLISKVLLFITFFLPGHLLFSQQEPDTAIAVDGKIGDVIVSANRKGVPFSAASRSISVISRHDKHMIPSAETAGLLEMVTGVDVRQRGAPGQQADISIRGGTFDQTLVLINGVNISDPQTGHHNLDLPLDLNAIDRVEVLRGPGARIFGPNAFNGAINIITSVPLENSLKVTLSGGSHGLANAAISASSARGVLTDLFSGSFSRSDGYISNTDFSNFSLFNRMKIALSKGSIDLQAGIVSKAFGANSFYTPKYPDQYEATKTFFMSLKADHGTGLSPVFYWRRHYDRFELFRNEAPVWYLSHNYHVTDAIGSDLNYTFRTRGRFKTSVGYSIRYETIRSNKLGDSLSEPVRIAGTGGRFYYLGAHRVNTALMAEESWSAGRWDLTAGLLVNYFSGGRGLLSLYPGADAGFKITEHLRWYASFNRTLRHPTFTDLYYNDAVSIGNPDLLPEKAVVLETGLKYYTGSLKAEMNLFSRRGSDMIDWVRAEGDDKWEAVNYTSVTLTGTEIMISYDFRGNASRFLTSASAGYSYLCADKSSEGFQSKYLLDILRNKLDLRIIHHVAGSLSASWNLSWQDRNGGFVKYENGLPVPGEAPFDDVWLLDAMVTGKFRSLTLFAEVTNITNSQYYDLGNVLRPGRWVRAGLTLTLPGRK